MAYPYRQPYGPRDAASGTFNNMNGAESRGGGLMRRFTTNALPSLSPIGQQRRQAAGDTTMSGLQNRFAPSERRIRHIERLLEQQRHINAELEKIDDETRREVEDGLRHERNVSDMIAQSEPTTPPVLPESLSNVSTRPHRFSSASLTSPPPGINTRPHRSSIQLTSSGTGMMRPYTSGSSIMPSQSVPNSRRQSDDEEESDVLFYDPPLHRSAANPNRNSMPITSYDRKRNLADIRSSLGALDSRSFFDDDEPSALPSKTANKTSPPDFKTYLQVQHTADGFPKLIRRDDNGELVSGFSAALDLALTQPSYSEQQVNERATASRHRFSLPPTASSSNGNIAPLNSILASANDLKSAANSRRSLEVKFTAETKRPSLMATPPRGMPNGIGKSQSSYSTNDIPTLKSIDGEQSGEQSGGVSINSPANQPTIASNSAITDLSSLNLDRSIMPESTSNHMPRHPQEFANIGNSQHHHDFNSTVPAALHSVASPLGTPLSPDANQAAAAAFQHPNMPLPNATQFYSGYNMPALNNGFNSMSIGGGFASQAPWPNQAPPFQTMSYGGFQQYPASNQAVAGAMRYSDPNRINPQPRRSEAEEAYNSINIPDITGQIYGLCKDQHGCRFLQRKLKEQNEGDLQIIFNEVKDHFQELMVDPFGNYLCQRLIENCTDDQRTVLVENAAPSMTRIALNQHGTRALQRMIELVSTPEQTNMLIEALRFDVVQLIQDLNGNHVMQKCLNHLSSEDAQFIFDAVGANCVVVGTHRHGCCVLQRCVDHASGLQKGAMVDAVIANAFALVQDPFGNYVVQYILDLNEPCFTEPLCLSFSGNVSYLSKQKFSSNVMEKCIRCASPSTRRILIQEITSPAEIDRMLRDSFGNYVIQTAMEFADEETKTAIIETLRPMLPTISGTPYGRRIRTKVQEWDNGVIGAMNSIATSPLTNHSAANGNNLNTPPAGRANRMGMVGAPPQWTNGNVVGAPGVASGFGGTSHAFNMLNGGPNGAQSYINGNQSYPNGNQNNLNGSHNHANGGYGGQGFGRHPPHGHF